MPPCGQAIHLLTALAPLNPLITQLTSAAIKETVRQQRYISKKMRTSACTWAMADTYSGGMKEVYVPCQTPERTERALYTAVTSSPEHEVQQMHTECEALSFIRIHLFARNGKKLFERENSIETHHACLNPDHALMHYAQSTFTASNTIPLRLITLPLSNDQFTGTSSHRALNRLIVFPLKRLHSRSW